MDQFKKLLGISKKVKDSASISPDEELSSEDARLLSDIGMLESTGGLYTNHATIKSKDSIHRGHAAIGTYGLMPNTLKELYKRKKAQGVLKEPFTELVDPTPEQLAQIVRDNPQAEEAMARYLLKHLRSKGANDEQAAVMWQYGHNMPLDKVNKLINKLQYNEGSRVAKFRALRKKLTKAE